MSATGNEVKNKAPIHSWLKKRPLQSDREPLLSRSPLKKTTKSHSEPLQATPSHSEPLKSHREPLVKKNRATLSNSSLARAQTGTLSSSSRWKPSTGTCKRSTLHCHPSCLIRSIMGELGTLVFRLTQAELNARVPPEVWSERHIEGPNTHAELGEPYDSLVGEKKGPARSRTNGN